jgi:hypothetical protein
MEYQPNVRALLELSGCKDIQLESRMMDIVKSAPDPETGTRHILSFIPLESPVLENKWRKHISQLWATAHPRIPKSLHMPLTSREVAFSSVLVEVHTLIQELKENPTPIYEDTKAHFLQPTEEARIARKLSVFGQDSLHVRRTCALLEELRLVRSYKGQVRIVESRYREFQALPLPSQYYLLWHIDMYHLDWKEYFHEWGSHLVVFQQYLPMVWEMVANMQVGDSQSMDELTARIVRSFRPMWQQELAIGLYEQSVLQGMIETWLIDRVFARYDFITSPDSRMFEWTQVGQRMLELERTTKLPCSTDVLS